MIELKLIHVSKRDPRVNLIMCTWKMSAVVPADLILWHSVRREGRRLPAVLQHDELPRTRGLLFDVLPGAVSIQYGAIITRLIISKILPWFLMRTTYRLLFWHYRDATSVLRSITDDSTACWTVHDDVIKWKHFQRYWPFVRGILRWQVNSPHKGQWHEALVFSLICAWTNGWANHRNADDLRRHRDYYDVTVMWIMC